MGIKRVAQVIGVKPDQIHEYERIHREVWPGVLDAISRHNIRNYSIFRDGDRLLSYFEYVGNDYEADMAAIAADSTTREWWTHTDPMQVPDADRQPGEWWKVIPEVFHTD
ncbi:MAG TPA: L-rhamnose mutarotase [Thermomicrobiales bacterium]|nr:L-rhamnose mutarotase [Thermomicrobiales bacterium]